MLSKHMDEAKQDSLEALRKLLAAEPDIRKAVMIDDLFGRIRVLLWAPEKRSDLLDKVKAALGAAAGAYWSGDVWMAEAAELSEADRLVYDRAWAESQPVRSGEDRLRVVERRRNRSGWFRKIESSPWPIEGERAGPPILCFFSFKGAAARARSGLRGAREAVPKRMALDRGAQSAPPGRSRGALGAPSDRAGSREELGWDLGRLGGRHPSRR
jgi:hypothetical protein